MQAFVKQHITEEQMKTSVGLSITTGKSYIIFCMYILFIKPFFILYIYHRFFNMFF